MTNPRRVNLRFMCCGLHFDAAVDCDWTLHYYPEHEKDVTPIELYCFDHTEWGIRMMFHKERNDQQDGGRCGAIHVTCVDIDAIKKEARRWVREMRRKSK